MCDKNVKSEYILIKLCALVFEYICKRTTEFHEKILFHSGVINMQIPITKYLGFPAPTNNSSYIGRVISFYFVFVFVFVIQRCLLQSFVTCKQLA